MGNKNANKVKKVSRTLPQNSLGTVTNKQKAMKLMERLEIYILGNKTINLLDDTPNQPSTFRTKALGHCKHLNSSKRLSYRKRLIII